MGRHSPALAGAGLLLWLLAPSSAVAQTGFCDGISPASGPELTSVLIGHTFVRPVLATSPPGDTQRLFVVEKDGRIQIVKDGARLATAFLDIEPLVLSELDGGGREEGLLGLAFHPDYETNGWFFVYHTDILGDNVVARYTRSTLDADQADSLSRQTVLPLPHPAPRNNHNGGMLAFGPLDGYLYIGTGDGGGGCDPDNNALSGDSLLGKLLRLNVDALPYSIPPDNPFVGDAGVRDEIWARGLRNPWRFSFDGVNGDLYIGDVGQNEWEEIDYRPGGSTGGDNYGWDVYEGTHCPNPSCTSSSPDCGVVADHVPPVHEYPHSVGCSVTGGYVYRGCRIPDLLGTYFFADYCFDTIHSLRMAGGVATEITDRTAELDPPGTSAIANVSSFGEDARGEIYITDLSGKIFKILPVLANLEVSGGSAAPFLPGEPDWTWEDLQATSSHPVTSYRVYRSDGNGSASFHCVFQGSSPVWPGGDAGTPLAGNVHSYLVTALNSTGEETSPGTGTNGTARFLSAVVCPQ